MLAVTPSSTVDLDTGHSPFLSAPDRLVSALEEAFALLQVQR
jgi:hypothetical protein